MRWTLIDDTASLWVSSTSWVWNVPEALCALLQLGDVLFSHGRQGIVHTPSGITYICPLGNAALSYLHKLFRGFSDQELEELEANLGFSLADDYKLLLRATGGAILFDNTIFIYGITDNLDRSLSMDNQSPGSILANTNKLRELGQFGLNSPWLPIGALAAAVTSYKIEVGRQGECRLAAPDARSRVYPNFLSCLVSISSVMDTLTNENGLIDESGWQLENEINAMVSSAIQ